MKIAGSVLQLAQEVTCIAFDGWQECDSSNV